MIQNLKLSGPGHDLIHIKLIKAGIGIIVPILTKFINNSFDRGIFPNSLKIAKITPIFKSGDSTDMANYRPISILPCLSKIFEKIVYERISSHLTENNIITKAQFGFVKGLSTDSAIINLMNNILPDLDSNKHVIGLFMDLHKAFDVIDHRILLTKLHPYGFRMNAHGWLKSYLNNRLQYTTIDDSQSPMEAIEQGVPQGSILGPLLFNIFINDIVNCSDVLRFLLYADDSNTFCSHTNLYTLIDIMNTELVKLTNWFDANKLAINMKKTHYLLFTRKKNCQGRERPLYLKGCRIKEEKNTKFLGIIID